MKVLLIGSAASKNYSGVFFTKVERAVQLLDISYDCADPSDDINKYPGYDLYFGVGDELFRRMPELVAGITGMGGTTVDFRTKYLPNKPKVWLKTLLQKKECQTDYVFTHRRDNRKNCFYVGQGVDDKFLYPEHDNILTVYVDHSFENRQERVQSILDQCREFYGYKKNVRIWYHCADGIVENKFDKCTEAYQFIPFEQLSSFYRKTHIFLPTHRETQGVVASEISLCGGLTLLEKWMYPKDIISSIPHQLYNNTINWPEKIDITANLELGRKNYSLQAFANRIKTGIDGILK